jgi:uracil-DNA glycosylase family 4
MKGPAFDPDCRACPRLAAFLDEVAADHPDYHCRPVPPFGDPEARLLVVGLAPGMHGANRTGRPFTGDYAGVLLYSALHQFGFATRSESLAADDGLELPGCRITNAVKCLPPANKPVGAEINTCNVYLGREIAGLPEGAVILALGGIAHRAVVKAIGGRQADFAFGHGACHDLGAVKLLDSYHCSRYNTNTGRLTDAMFRDVVAEARRLIDLDPDD